MSDDPDHLPCLHIPPDHPLAAKLYDADALRWGINDKINAAILANDTGALDLQRKAFDVCNAEIAAILDEYRNEVGGSPGQKVGLTYKNRRPVVTARPWPTEH